MGFETLGNNTDGVGNTANGADALVLNQHGNLNTAMGDEALSNNLGSDNTGIGFNALQSNTIAGGNTAVGANALEANAGDAEQANTAMGGSAGLTDTGSHDTFLGYNADSNVAGLTGATAIGANATVGESNAIVLGCVSTCVPFLESPPNVGIGTTTPHSPLTVNGNIEIDTIGNGIKFPDGSVQTSAGIGVAPGAAGTYLRSDGTNWSASGIQAGDLPAGSPSYIQNGTSPQANANFNMSGNGTLGGSLTVAGNSTLGGTLAVTGNSTLGGTLAVAGTGNSSFAGSVTVAKNLQVGAPSSTYGTYLQIPLISNTAGPPAGDCNSTTLVGRMVWQYNTSASASKALTLWVCAPTGKWITH